MRCCDSATTNNHVVQRIDAMAKTINKSKWNDLRVISFGRKKTLLDRNIEVSLMILAGNFSQLP